MRGEVAPSHDDPFVAAASQAIGGPVGKHARRHPSWTPLRVVLALVTLAGALNVLHTAPCQAGAWWSGASYADLCYSDLPLDFVPRGHAEGLAPYAAGGAKYAPTTDPAPVAVLAWGAAAAARALSGDVDVAARAEASTAELSASPEVRAEAVTYYGVYALVMVVAMLALAALLVGLSGRRPFDAAAFAAAPVLVAAATIGWDLLGVALAVGAMYAWSRDRLVAGGMLLGTAVAAAVWPLVVLVAMLPVGLPVGLRAARAGAVLRVAAVATSTWVAWQLPAWLLARDSWWGTVNHTLDGGIGYGSLWRVAVSYGMQVSPRLLVTLVVAAVGLVVLGVLALAASAPRPPRLSQVVLLALIGGLVVWPVYSPQYVLWLLPFAVLARPRWRDLLWWQAGELFYFLAVWWTLSGATVDSGGVDKVYTTAIVVRVVAELALTGVVVRDVLHPECDPVRAAGWSEGLSRQQGTPRGTSSRGTPPSPGR